MSDILSICIPTYNRIKSLQALLEYLLPITSQLGVPVYVSDNASTDGTEAMIYNLKHSYDLLFYDRNISNLGPDYNFEHVLKMSSAKYAWLLSDDDVVNVNELEKIISILLSQKYDLLVVNGGAGDYLRVQDVPTQCYTDMNKLLNDIGWHMQWMSCLIYSRKMIETADFAKFRNTYLLQFGIIFDYLALGNNHNVYWNADRIINQSVVSNGEKNVSWADKTFLIFSQNWCNVINSFSSICYTTWAKQKCILDHGIKSGLFNEKNLLRLSMQGVFTRKILSNYAVYIKQSIVVPYWKLYLIAMCPILSATQYKFFKNIYKRIKC